MKREVRRGGGGGAGTIGASWAAYFLAHGLAVTASDPAPDGEERLRDFVDAAWPVLVKLGANSAKPPHDALTFVAEPETAVEGADFVQEQAPEREDVKKALLAR